MEDFQGTGCCERRHGARRVWCARLAGEGHAAGGTGGKPPGVEVCPGADHRAGCTLPSPPEWSPRCPTFHGKLFAGLI